MIFFKTLSKQILVLAFLCTSLTTFAQSNSGLLEKYIVDFKSGGPLEKQLICKKLMWSGLSDSSLFDLLEQDLVSRAKTANGEDGEEINNIAWLMKAIGASGQLRYLHTLEIFASHPNDKIAKYAKESINFIPQYAKWNPIISDSSQANTERSEIINRYANMIRSEILELNILAAKRIYAEKIHNEYLYGLLSEKIIAGHKSVHKNEKTKIAAYAWMMRASVITNVATAQKVLETATNKKLKKYAKKYIAANKR
jgi:hypothetical protein